MKTIIELVSNNREIIWHVTSEPGDATRYDYYTSNLLGSSQFTFMPRKSIFSFPQRIDFYHIRNLDVSIETVNANSSPIGFGTYSQKEHPNINPWTVAECIRTVQELFIALYEKESP